MDTNENAELKNIASNAFLSTTEDAFEHFQAKNLDEDSDYVLLSDLVPSSSSQSQELPEIPDTILKNSEYPEPGSLNIVEYLNTTVSAKKDVTDDKESEVANLGRGRRKRKANNMDNSRTTDTSVEVKPKGKRGRKPKNICTPSKDNSTEQVESTEQTKVLSRTRARKNNSKSIANGSSTGAKRGRKKKQPSLQPTSDTQSGFTAIHGIEPTELDDDADDMCLSKLKHKLPKHNATVIEANSLEKSLADLFSDNKNDSVENNTVSDSTFVSDFSYNAEKIISKGPNVIIEAVDNSNLISTNNTLSQKSMDIKENLDTEITLKKELNKNEKSINDKIETEKSMTDIPENSLLVEDTTKRPIRVTRRKMQYDLDSEEEDPFTNMVISDDEPSSRKSRKYYSDDEYVPDKKSKTKAKIITESSESAIDDDDFDDKLVKKPKKLRSRKKSDKTKSPQKQSKPKISVKTAEVTTILPNSETGPIDDDIEECLQSSVITASDKTLLVSDVSDSELELPNNKIENRLGNSEFENFIANKINNTAVQIKKVSNTNAEAVAPLDIPIIDPKELIKTVETSSQTKKIQTTSTEMQTDSPYAIKLKTNKSLTEGQSNKACELLTEILKSTTELGNLMTQKSKEFMTKKINEAHVKDTNNMDYCVKKAKLLFKLAKDNLTTMEDNLEKEYEKFITENKLTDAVEIEKKIAPKASETNSDSDCEIIEGPVPVSKHKKPFNPKTVFLNKELSIKIAKKMPERAMQQTKKALEIKGRHSVWISDSVMVKKVTPNQSFLAQDSRNKKPPDTPYITEDMVKDFFDNYQKEQALRICALYNSPYGILPTNHIVPCFYFLNNSDVSSSSTCTETEPLLNVTRSEVDEFNNETSSSTGKRYNINMPKSLFTLCTEIIIDQVNYNSNLPISNGLSNSLYYQTESLFDLCFKHICKHLVNFSNTATQLKICKVECRNLNCKEITYKQPLSLKEICFDKISFLIEDGNRDSEDNMSSESKYASDMDMLKSPLQTLSPNHLNCKQIQPLPLKKISFDKILFLIKGANKDLENDVSDMSSESKNTADVDMMKSPLPTLNPNSLISLSLEAMKTLLYSNLSNDLKKPIFQEVKSLADICSQFVSHYFNNDDISTPPCNNMTIDTVNTLTEEAFHNINASSEYPDEESYDDADDEDYDDADDAFGTENYENEAIQTDDYNWVSQLQMQVVPSATENLEQNGDENALSNDQIIEPVISQIKSEPMESDLNESEEIINVKREPDEVCNETNEMVHIPNEILAKAELTENTDEGFDSYEAFMSKNNIMPGEIFSQTPFRVRRQFEPDPHYEDDHGDVLDLLVPQNSDTAKEILMESDDSDENSCTNKKKSKDIKKPSKVIKKPKPKKQPKVVEKPVENNEIAMLTRRMKERIKNQERKEASSESELDDTLEKVKNKTKQSLPEATEPDSKKTKNKKSTTDQIQINNIDSKNKKGATDQIQVNNIDSTEKDSNDGRSSGNSEEFPGFSAVDQNEILNYQKYVNYVYDKIVSKKSEELITMPNINDSVVNIDEPAEILECAPTLPIFDEEYSKRKTRSKKKIENEIIHPQQKKDETKPLPVKESIPVSQKETKFPSKNETPPLSEIEDLNKQMQASPAESVKEHEFENSVADANTVEKNGWTCFPMNGNDPKLYQIPYVGLDKLPEEFVETYFRFLEVNDISKEDEEVDRLTNIQSLHRGAPSGPQGTKVRVRKGMTDGMTEEHTKTVDTVKDGLDTCSDHLEELTPSDDEGTGFDDEMPPPIDNCQSDNAMAKNLLMNEQDSDHGESEKDDSPKKDPTKRPKPKSLVKVKEELEVKSEPDVMVHDNVKALQLTADKTMKRQLELLHAPVQLEDVDVKPNAKEPLPSKPKDKPMSKHRSKRESIENDGYSSTEEEKQWVTTKKKILEKMEKKSTEDISYDDAKRARLVREFIEKRGVKASSSLRMDTRRYNFKKTGRRSKRYLERQKQLRVLSYELYGEEATHSSKSSYINHSKGRRNIRKVIDKKSLARSTVLANMEEFERKKRLAMKHSRLIELLGIEEGVNVLVINDEVCLEYDFEELQPIVSIHQFFTGVMKAHQYEGVKFMWDACFESLQMVQSGSPGGGCILAHCMGLGKTLQVLALLHTVLSLPKAGMRRALVVCPLSTVLNWVDEIHKWLGPVTDQIKVYELSQFKKIYQRARHLSEWYEGGGIFIMGYELFRSLSTLDPLLDKVPVKTLEKIHIALLDPGPDIIICDEGHLLKNDSSVLAVSMSRVRTKRRIVLTGTPMQNNLREYYCMVNFVKPNLLGTYSEYSNRFENPIMNGQHRDSQEEDIRLMKTRTHILHKVLEGCLQRQEASVLYPYLPKKHEYTVFISLTQCQIDLYKHYLDFYSKKSKQSILKDFHILQKIWTHPRVLHNFQMQAEDRKKALEGIIGAEDDLAREELKATEDVKPAPTEVWWLPYLDGGQMLDCLESSTKFLTVFKILNECVQMNDKLLIFSTSLFTMDALEYFLQKINKWSLGQEYYRLDGSVPTEVRQKWCREFNAEHNLRTKLFLISTRAGSLGLNMTAANRVIILDTSWNPAHDIQSIFRVYRFGQKKDCFIYRLVAMGTMEQKIYERAVTKQAVACRVVDEQQIDRHYSSSELNELYSFDWSGSGVAGGVAAGVRDVALLRVAREVSELHAVHEHDSLLRDHHDQDLPAHERDEAWHQFQLEQHTKQIAQLQTTAKIKQPSKKNSQKKLQESHPPPLTDLNEDPSVKQEQNHTPTFDTFEQLPTDAKQCKTKTTKYVQNENRAPIIRLTGSSMSNANTKEIMDCIMKNLQNLNYKEGKLVDKLVMAISSKIDNVVINVTEQNEIELNIERAVIKKTNVPVVPTISSKRKSRHKVLTDTNDKKVSDLTADEQIAVIGGKRRAATKATRLINNVILHKNNDATIIDDDDDGNDYVDDQSDNDYQPKSYQRAVMNKNKIESQSQIKQPEATAAVAANPSINLDDDSIVLSDEEKEEIVPLPVSLLTNKNFIKIIGYTYSKGNPPLEESSAQLAAEYSTSKLLREVKETGQLITDGPIYDIAVSLLGKLQLKKLHEADLKNSLAAKDVEPCTSQSVTVTTKATVPPPSSGAGRGRGRPKKYKQAVPEPNVGSLTVKSTETMSARSRGRPKKIVHDLSLKEVTESDTPQPVSMVQGPQYSNEPATQYNNQPATQYNNQPVTQYNNQPVTQYNNNPVAHSVVPVGFIQSAGNSHSIIPANAFAQQESILPDDDDVLVVDPPQAQLQSQSKRGQLTVNQGISSANSPHTAAPPTVAAQIPPIKIKIRKPLINEASVAPNTDNTICLDSDDDELSLVTEPPSAPQPVSLTAANNPARLNKKNIPNQLTKTTLKIINPTTQQPVVLQPLNVVQGNQKNPGVSSNTQMFVIPASLIQSLNQGQTIQKLITTLPQNNPPHAQNSGIPPPPLAMTNANTHNAQHNSNTLNSSEPIQQFNVVSNAQYNSNTVTVQTPQLKTTQIAKKSTSKPPLPTLSTQKNHESNKRQVILKETKEKSPEVTRGRSLSEGSSSNSSSRSASPVELDDDYDDDYDGNENDPLSLFKNVVHIQADPVIETPVTEPPKKTLDTKNTSSKADKYNNASSFKQNTSTLKASTSSSKASTSSSKASTSSSKASTSLLKASTSHLKTCLKNTGLSVTGKLYEKIKSNSAIISKNTTARIGDTSYSKLRKSLSISEDVPLRLMGSFDLTDNDPPALKEPRTDPTILSRGKTSSTKSLPSVPNVNKIAHVMNSVTQKRKATTRPAADSKQKLAKKPTRLEDFDIDDMEDIIELE